MTYIHWLMFIALVVVGYIITINIAEENEKARERRERRELAERIKEAERLADKLTADRPATFLEIYFSPTDQMRFNRVENETIEKIMRQHWIKLAKDEAQSLMGAETATKFPKGS